MLPQSSTDRYRSSLTSPVSGKTSTTATWVPNGNVSGNITVVTGYGSATSDIKFTSDLTFIEEELYENDFKIYPNPASKEIFSTVEGDYFWYNSLGEMLHSGKTNFSRIEVPEVANGLYFLRIKSHKVIHMEKVRIGN